MFAIISTVASRVLRRNFSWDVSLPQLYCTYVLFCHLLFKRGAEALLGGIRKADPDPRYLKKKTLTKKLQKTLINWNIYRYTLVTVGTGPVHIKNGIKLS